MQRILLVVLGIAASGCGVKTQADARDHATSHSCDFFQRCGKIGAGSGAMYPDRDHCEVQVRSFWDSAWPVKDCDGHINDAALDTCLKAIDITDCNNGGDFLNTTFNKCAKSSVCGG